MPEKPNFSNGHYHHYVWSPLASGPLRMFARVPADLAWSFVGTRFGWLAERLGRGARAASKPQPRAPNSPKTVEGGHRTFRLSELEEDRIYPITDEVCVARIGKSRIVAFNRKCPHGGSDLALGTVTDGQVTCPWHNLRFDPNSGASACKSLDILRLYEVWIEGEEVTVSLEKRPTVAAE